MGTPGGFDNFGRERTGRAIGEEHRQKLLKKAEVRRIQREIREPRKADKEGGGEAPDRARARSFTALGVIPRVIAIIVLTVILLALVVVLVRGVWGA